MDLLPDSVVEYILSKLSNAKDVASCKCVSKKWKDSMSYLKSLCFPRGIFDNLIGPQTPDSIVMQMVSSVSRLEKLVVSCPFTGAGLASCMLVAGLSLKNLELCVNNNHLSIECIQAARNLESLRLCHLLLLPTPKWDVFHQLLNLEIVGAVLSDWDLREILCVTPNLTRLVISGCKGLSTVRIKLLELRHCQLDVYNRYGWSLTLRAPMIQHLEVEGSNWIIVHETNCLKSLSICTRRFQVVTMVELGDNLMALESLSIKVFQGCWEVITNILQLATQVKHLCGEFVFTQVNPFPSIDFVDFFKSHPKLKSFYIGGGMIDALCNNYMPILKKVDSSFVIPCLEEVVIIVKSPPPPLMNAKTICRLIESLLKHGNKLNAITVNAPSIDFSKEIRSNDSINLHIVLAFINGGGGDFTMITTSSRQGITKLEST